MIIQHKQLEMSQILYFLVDWGLDSCNRDILVGECDITDLANSNCTCKPTSIVQYSLRQVTFTRVQSWTLIKHVLFCLYSVVLVHIATNSKFFYKSMFIKWEITHIMNHSFFTRTLGYKIQFRVCDQTLKVLNKVLCF